MNKFYLKQLVCCLTIFSLIVLFGCSSGKGKVVSLPSVQTIQKPAIETETRNDRGLEYLCISSCEQEYRSALEECMYLVAHETEYNIKDRQLKKCIKVKGFENGSEQCHLKCKSHSQQ